NLCFQCPHIVSTRLQWSEERRGPPQVALGLCDIRLEREGIDVVGCDIKNLIKLSQRLGKTALKPIRSRVLAKQVDIAGVEPLGFVEVTLAPVPLTSPPLYIGQRFRNTATIGQELPCLLKVTHGGVVILQAGVVVIPLRQYGLAQIRLKGESGFGCLPRLLTQGDRWLKIQCAVAPRFH